MDDKPKTTKKKIRKKYKKPWNNDFQNKRSKTIKGPVESLSKSVPAKIMEHVEAGSIFPSVLQQEKRGMLSALMEVWSITAACKLVGIDRKTHYNWMFKDDEYAAAFHQARKMGGYLMEDEMFRRGHQGIEENVYNKDGEVVGTKRKYSDLLLIVLAKGTMPEKYKDNPKNGPGDMKVTLEFLVSKSFDPPPKEITHSVKGSSNGNGHASEK